MISRPTSLPVHKQVIICAGICCLSGPHWNVQIGTESQLCDFWLYVCSRCLVKYKYPALTEGCATKGLKYFKYFSMLFQNLDPSPVELRVVKRSVQSVTWISSMVLDTTHTGGASSSKLTKSMSPVFPHMDTFLGRALFLCPCCE